MIDQPSFIDSASWPTELEARVIDPSTRRFHGYDLERDLARLPLGLLNYLSIRSELPSREKYRLFEVASWYASSISVDSAAVHAPILGRLVGTTVAAVHGAAALGVAEWALAMVESHRALIDALVNNRPIPSTACAACEESAEPYENLRSALGDALTETRLPEEPALCRNGLVLTLFSDSGLVSTEQLVRAVHCAALPVALAEAFAASYGRFLQYPVNLPAMVADEREG